MWSVPIFFQQILLYQINFTLTPIIARASNSTQAKQIFTDSLTQAINSKRFQAIIKSKWCDFYPKSIFKTYSKTQKLQTKNMMKPVTGCLTVPKFIAYPPNDSKRNQ